MNAPIEDPISIRIQDEIDAIRLALIEKTKGMNAEEHTNYFIQLTAPLLKQYGINAVSLIDEPELNSVHKKIS
jgi:hypothetical protein